MVGLVGESASPRWLARSLTRASHADKIRARYLHSNPPGKGLQIQLLFVAKGMNFQIVGMNLNFF